MTLEFFPTEQLLDEIFRRYDFNCFIGMKILTDKEDNEYKRKWKGNTHTCCGLCDDLKEKMLQNFREGENEIKE